MSASKREQLVEQALQAFYRGGFHAIGMDKLAAETGVSKTSMYKHFRTKEDLILATLRLRDEQFRNWMVRRIEAAGSDPKGQLTAMFDALDEWFHEEGFKSCMFIKASSEYQDFTHPIHATAAEHKRLMRDYIRRLAEAAEARDPDQLARQLLIIIEGAIVIAHLHGADGVAADSRDAAGVLIDNAIPNGAHR